MAQLSGRFDDVIEPPDVGLRVQPAMRVAGQCTVNTQSSALHEASYLTLPQKPSASSCNITTVP